MEDLKERIHRLLSAHHLRLNTELGQHFLIDEDILETIVSTADIHPGERVVEIGPGIGILTEKLLEAEAQVTAIELDARLIPLLKEYTKAPKHLTIVQSNALRADFPDTPYKIAANIPYHITSPLLRHAFLESKPPLSLTLLIQKEVALKICDTSHAGILTILVGLFGTPAVICKVPPSAFLPPPAVDSAVLHIQAHRKPLADGPTIETIFTLTKAAFGQKRKMLRNSLGSLPDGADLLEKTGIDPMRRPETLTLHEWIALAQRHREVLTSNRTDDLTA